MFRNEGRIRPSLIAAEQADDDGIRRSSNEGRIRPSLIAAGGARLFLDTYLTTRGEFAPPSLRQKAQFRIPSWWGQRGANSPLPHCGMTGENENELERVQRGANSPLPHCGGIERVGGPDGWGTTRGEFAPPSLRRLGGFLYIERRPATRGEFAPPSLRPEEGLVPTLADGATRGEFAPPSLRPELRSVYPTTRKSNEGRIRPSLIAASPSRPNTPYADNQRGANSPLPHCGDYVYRIALLRQTTTRGEFAPPSLRL